MNTQDHVPSPNGQWCLFCGARSVDGSFGTEAMCLPRDDGFKRSALRPEPALRPVSCEDQATISQRLIELAQQRTDAMNEPAKD